MAVNLATSTIVRQAVIELERSDLSGFGENSEFGQAIAAAYPQALEFCLEREDWSFASRLASLPPASADEAPADPDLPTLFKIPAGCVRLREIITPGAGHVLWRLDGDFLRTDATASIMIRYTAKTDREDALPVSFRDAVALRLAVLLSPRWLQTRTKRVDLVNMADRALSDAKTNDRVVSSGRQWDGGTAGADWASEAVR